jgi:hypothetical protein
VAGVDVNELGCDVGVHRSQHRLGANVYDHTDRAAALPLTASAPSSTTTPCPTSTRFRAAAEWALWQLGTDAEALAPHALRASLRNRAQAISDRYRTPS